MDRDARADAIVVEESAGGAGLASGSAGVVEGEAGDGAAPQRPSEEDGTVEAAADQHEGRASRGHRMSLRVMELMLNQARANPTKASQATW